MNIAVFGGNGLVGSAIVNILKKDDTNKIFAPSSKDLDLLGSYTYIREVLNVHNIEQVYFCAAKVGGILANRDNPVEFFMKNMQLGMNVIKACHESKTVKKVLNLGSTCIYPKVCPQPMKEEHLMTGIVEPTNEGYALAKISTLKLCQFYKKQYGDNFISVMPTNVYGPNDNYHPQNAHAVASMIRKVHEAKKKGEKQIICWGDGSPVREFIYSEDLAEGLIFVMENYNGDEFLNIGTGSGETIKHLYEIVMEVLDFEGELIFDAEKPNGNPFKVCDTTKINNLGWKSKISLEEGIIKTYEHLKSTGFNWKEK